IVAVSRLLCTIGFGLDTAQYVRYVTSKQRKDYINLTICHQHFLSYNPFIEDSPFNVDASDFIGVLGDEYE
ncbi:MAG: hypothetical protein MR011_01975, partial [Lachnospiraceae bacterium]|nr:hypothetical protein [Lachnospiraceae bacterium]